MSILFLKYFLKKTFNWDWIDEANFISDVQERTIEIRNSHNPEVNTTIRIINDGKMAILRQNSKKMFEFRISETDAMISFEIKTPLKRIDTVNSQFLEKSALSPNSRYLAWI
jgi:inhibitor of KinA sporulation pathway (predicted exonuclease)